MKNVNHQLHKQILRGFTLIETVIAVGVLVVLLTAFIGVFGPATKGIRRAVNVQEADRLAYLLESELTTLREGVDTESTGFEKAYNWIKDGGEDKPILVYQYRGNPSSLQADNTMTPYIENDGVAGKDYVVQGDVRQHDNTIFNTEANIAALEGGVYIAKLTQLVMQGGEWKKSTEKGKIINPFKNAGGSPEPDGSNAEQYPEAVIAFTADFYQLPNLDRNTITNAAKLKSIITSTTKKPMFSRNLAVRR